VSTGTGAGRIDRILLIQPRWMGDVLLCTPAVRAARRAFPSAVLDFLTEPAGAGVLHGNARLDDVLVARPGTRERWTLLREVRRRRYDAVVDFRSTGSTAQVAWLSGASRRIGVRGRGPRNLAYTDLLPRPDPGLYVVRQKLALLGPLGVRVEEVADLSLELAVGEAERTWAEGAWKRMGLDGAERVVAVSAVARDPRKQWGAERWAALADLLVEEGSRVLLTHGPGEEEQVRRVARAMRGVPVHARAVDTPGRLAALYERATLWVGHDGGPKHVAVAAGVPTVSVIRAGLGPAWTDTSPGSPHRFVDGAGTAADPRGGLDALTVVEVARVVFGALTARP
jgi:heptosyltransferase III